MALPDNELHMAEVHKLVDDVRNAPHNESAAKTVQMASATPIFLGKAHEVVPHSYMLHYKVQHCKGCGRDVTLSQFYAKSHIRSRVTGKAVTHLTPCDTPLYNLPMETALVGRTEVPCCHACMDSFDLSNLPYPPSTAQLYDLDEPRLKGQKPPKEAKAKVPKTTTKATLDDLA